MSNATTTLPGRPTVLVVDDVPENVNLLVDILQDDYEIKVALGGERAIKIVQSDKPPDLILLDVMMPAVNGYEVCRRVKADPSRSHIPIIFVTANGEPAEEEYGLSLGAADYITKPFNAAIVLARLKIHLALHENSRALEQQIVSTNDANAELKRTLEELGTTNVKLARAERLAAVGALVAGIAHELNTPIGNCVLIVTTLLEKCVNFEQLMKEGVKRSALEGYITDTRASADFLAKNLGRLSELVDRFKRLAVTETRSPRRMFELGDAVRQSTLMLEPLFAEKSVQLRVDISRSIAMDSFPEALVEVFNHLIQNALLHGFNRKTAGEVEITAVLGEPNWVTVTVQDNGDGIAPAHLSRVFDPFFTTRLGTGSNGLGLNIVHNLVTNVLGGSVSVTSEAGNTRFALRIPRNPTDPA